MEQRLASRPAGSPRFVRRAVALGLLAPVAVAAALAGAPAVHAQAGAPGLAVEAVHPLSGGEFHFIVTLSDANGDPLAGTTVTATPTSPGGTSGATVALPSAGDGTYQGPVALPEDGTWRVHITSADPAAEVDYGYAVTGDTGTPVTQPTTTVPATTAATTLPATQAPTTAPATSAATTTPAAAETAAQADEDDDSGFPIVVLVIVGAALVVALAGVPLALRTIRNANADRPSGSDGA